MAEFTVKEYNSLDELNRLRSAWDELLSAVSNYTVFDSWTWQMLSAKHLADGKNLAIISVNHGESLVAALPLHLKRASLAKVKKVQTYCCLGDGITDYNCCLLEEDTAEKSIELISNHLAQLGATLVFENILPGSNLDRLSGELIRAGFKSLTFETKNSLLAKIDADYERFRAGLKKKMRRNIRQNQNYMDRLGGYTYHHITADDAALLTLIDLHTSRWQYKGQAGALAARRLRQFHSGLLSAEDRGFEVRFFAIKHDDKIIAILYGFLLGNRFYAYLTGFDMEHNRISPGNMLVNYCIAQLSREGVLWFDMLRGDMEYKKIWATDAHTMEDLYLFPPGIKGSALYSAVKGIMGVKAVIPAKIKRRGRDLIGG